MHIFILIPAEFQVFACFYISNLNDISNMHQIYKTFINLCIMYEFGKHVWYAFTQIVF